MCADGDRDTTVYALDLRGEESTLYQEWTR